MITLCFEISLRELQAYLNEYPFLEYYIAKNSNCELELHENPIGQSPFGIAVAKGSPLRNIISEALLYLQEHGAFHILQTKWLSSKCEDGTINQHSQFSLEFFGTPFLMLTGVIIVTFIILLLEVLYWKFRKKRKQLHGFHLESSDSLSLRYYKKRTRSSLIALFWWDRHLA